MAFINVSGVVYNMVVNHYYQTRYCIIYVVFDNPKGFVDDPKLSVTSLVMQCISCVTK